MAFEFRPIPAVTDDGERAPEGSGGQVFDPADTSFSTPLTVQGSAGVNITTITVSSQGLTQRFSHETLKWVVWKSGSYIVDLYSLTGMMSDVEASRVAAQASREAAEAAVAAIPVGGTAGQVLAKASSDDLDTQWVTPSGGSGGGTSNHSALSNLANDDHPQYLNSSRGDARYFTQAQVTAAISAAVTAASASDRSRGNHTGTQAISTINGLQDALDQAGTGGGSAVRAMIVSSGSEPRPDGAAIVVWRDARTSQTTPPTNMGANDLWVTGSGAVAVDTVPPTVPTGLTVSAVTASSLTLSWTASTDNVGVTGYEVRRDGSISLGVATGTSRNVTGLSQSTAYQFQVRARDAAGNWSAWSTAASVTTASSTDTTPPTPPTGLSYTATSGSVTVLWGAGSDNVAVTGYDVRIASGAVTTVAASPRSHTFTGLDPSTPYTVEVRSRDGAGLTSSWVSLSTATLEESDTFSVFGDTAPPGTWVLGTDGTPTILTANPFYKFGSGDAGGLPTGRVVGAKVWVPAGATPPLEATFRIWAGGAAISATPVQTKVASMAGATAGSWFSAYFDTPVTMPADGSWFYVGVQFTGAGDAGKYVYGATARPSSGESIPSEDANIALAESASARISFRIGTGSVSYSEVWTAIYGVDIIVDEG